MNKKINWPLLAGVRFFLALIVLSEHLAWYIPETDITLKLAKFSALVAVLGFLVISGFSIAASYEANKNRFYFRRGLRIIPIYVASIVFTIVVTEMKQPFDMVSLGSGIDFFGVVGNLFFMQGIFVGSLEGNPVLWTLMIEVFFYIMTPLIDKQRAWVLHAVVISVFFFILQRYLGFYYYSQMEYGLGILFLGWAWLVGFWFYHNRNSSGAAFFLLSIGVVAIVINGYFADYFALITWLLICVSLCYGHLLKCPLPSVLNLSGDISYPIYVFHVPFFALISFFNINNNGFIYCLMILLFCLCIDLFYDKPLKTLFKKWLIYRVGVKNERRKFNGSFK